MIFTAGSGRSGTTSIARFFQANVKDCIAEHEPPPLPGGRVARLKNMLLGRPSYRFHDKGFGAAMRWYDGDDARLNGVVRRKADRIRKMECKVYLEANHSFLKSTCDGLASEFPDLALIHLTRDPLEVAKSFSNRISGRNGQRFERWNPLPGFNKNCLPMADETLSPFQRYLWMWIEIELRFVRFIGRNPDVSFFELDTQQLNDKPSMEAMLDCFGLEAKSETLRLSAPLNSNLVDTKLSDEDLEEAKAFLQRLPAETLHALRRPYQLLEIRGA